MRNISFVKKFALLSSIAFLITGLVLSFAVTTHLRNDKLADIQELTVLALDTILRPNFKASDFNSPLPKQREQILEDSIHEIMQSTNIIGIGIWNNEQTSIFTNTLSSNSSTHELMSKITSNKIQIRTSTLPYFEDGNIVTNKVIQLFAPIILDGKAVGTYEVIIPYKELQKHISSIAMTVVTIMVTGLFLLYLLLIKMISSASKTLVSQNQSLTLQKNELAKSYIELDASYKSTVIALSSTIDARDSYTAGHSQRVTKIALEIGEKLKLSPERLKILELAALLHDIGKIGVPDNVLNKPGKLTNDEYSQIKEHPVIGVKILEKIDFLEGVRPIILHHHEKYGGGGYPYGLAGENIPLEARIIAIADTYDAITSDRPYRKGAAHQVALKELLISAGLQFDMKVVQAFLEIEESKFDRMESNYA